MNAVIENDNQAKIIALLLTDGGITKTHFDRPGSWRLHYTGSEQLLLDEFKNSIVSLFGPQQFWEAKPKRATSIYINNSEIAEYFLHFSPTFRKKQCYSNPRCPKLKGLPFGACTTCAPIVFKDIEYPPVNIPEFADQPTASDTPTRRGLVKIFLQYYFSAEGTVSDRIQISQRHPTMLTQIQHLLLDTFRIKSSLKCYALKNGIYEWHLRVRKKDLITFHDHVNFLPVMQGRAGHEHITKKEKLERLIRA
jgi:hypothetical protein